MPQRQTLRVGAGTCAEVTYTPPTATTNQVGQICQPATKRSSVAILLVHGGGGYAGTYHDMDGWRFLYGANGYLTFAVDYRLATTGDVSVYPEPEQDIKAAIQFLRAHGSDLGIDRIVVHGSSAGARLGGIILTTPDDPSFSGDTLWTGVSDAADGFIGFYGYYDGYQFDPDRYYGTRAHDAAVSLLHASDASGPSLLVHGTDDALIGIAHSDELADALRRASKSVDLRRVPGVGHGFDVYGSQILTSVGNTEAVHVLNWLGSHFDG